MVASEVRVTTCRAGEDTGTVWVSDGEGSYSLDEAEGLGRVSIVTLTLREGEEYDAFLKEWTLREIVSKYSDFVEYPVLLILLPGFLGTAGALGGVLSSRLATKVHLGLVSPGAVPRGQAGGDLLMVLSLCLPVFAIAGVVAEVGGLLTDQASPGLWQIVAVSLFGGLLASFAVMVVAYYTTVVAIRFGLDPDTYGIPMVTSTLDFVGAFTLILALVAVGVA